MASPNCRRLVPVSHPCRHRLRVDSHWLPPTPNLEGVATALCALILGVSTTMTAVAFGQGYGQLGPTELSAPSAVTMDLATALRTASERTAPVDATPTLRQIDEYELAKKYSPVYYFHADENFYFTDAEWYISSSADELAFAFSYNMDCNNYPYFDESDDLRRDRWRIYFGSQIGLYTEDPDDFPGLIGFFNQNNINAIEIYFPAVATWLEQTNDDWGNVRIYKPERMHLPGFPCPDLEICCYHRPIDFNAPIYYIVETNTEGNVELQYWAYSHMDETYADYGYGEHDGDWTRVVLVFPGVSESAPLGVVEPPLYSYFSAHRGGDSPFHPRYLDWNDVRKENDSHASVLIAWGTHENYYFTDALAWPPPDGDYQFESIEWSTECYIEPFYVNTHEFWPFYHLDYYDPVGMSRRFVPRETRLINLGSGDNPLVSWVTYGGRWGYGNDDPLDTSDGPSGPFDLGAEVSIREHNILKSVDHDDDSWHEWHRRHWGITGCDSPFVWDVDWPFWPPARILNEMEFADTYHRLARNPAGVDQRNLFVSHSYDGRGDDRWPPGDYDIDWESGNFGAPFKLFSDLVDTLGVVSSPITVSIEPGMYSGPVTIDKKIVLRTWWGMHGNVIIGQ